MTLRAATTLNVLIQHGYLEFQRTRCFAMAIIVFIVSTIFYWAIWVQIPYIWYTLYYSWHYVDVLASQPLPTTRLPSDAFNLTDTRALVASSAALHSPFILTFSLGVVSFLAGLVADYVQVCLHNRGLARDPAYRTRALIDNSTRSTAEEAINQGLVRAVHKIDAMRRAVLMWARSIVPARAAAPSASSIVPGTGVELL